MRTFGYWCQNNHLPVINNVRWGTSETWEYCFDGIEHNSVVCVGSVASGLKELENRYDFCVGFSKMIDILNPRIIIIYGSANYEIFHKARDSGIEILSFISKTNAAFKKRGDNL